MWRSGCGDVGVLVRDRATGQRVGGDGDEKNQLQVVCDMCVCVQERERERERENDKR